MRARVFNCSPCCFRCSILWSCFYTAQFFSSVATHAHSYAGQRAENAFRVVFVQQQRTDSVIFARSISINCDVGPCAVQGRSLKFAKTTVTHLSRSFPVQFVRPPRRRIINGLGGAGARNDGSIPCVITVCILNSITAARALKRASPATVLLCIFLRGPRFERARALPRANDTRVNYLTWRRPDPWSRFCWCSCGAARCHPTPVCRLVRPIWEFPLGLVALRACVWE